MADTHDAATGPPLPPPDPGPPTREPVSQLDDYIPEIFDLNAFESESMATNEPSVFTTAFYTVAFRVPARHQKKEGKYPVFVLVRELFRELKKIDDGLALREPSIDGKPPTGDALTDPESLPKDEEKLRQYVHGLTVHQKTKRLIGQISVETTIPSFSKLKFHPDFFCWLRRSGFHVQLNNLTSFKIQAVGQLLHCLPSEARASHVEEALARLFPPSAGLPCFQLRSEFIYFRNQRTKVYRVFAQPSDAPRVQKLFRAAF
jgi:hypothetical protein